MSFEPKKFPSETMEEAGPKADMVAVPVLLIGLFALLFFWGLVQLDDHGGGFSSQVYQPFDSLDMVNERNKAAHPN